MGPKNWIIPRLFPAAWASGYGEDEFGYWMSFSVYGIRQPWLRL